MNVWKQPPEIGCRIPMRGTGFSIQQAGSGQQKCTGADTCNFSTGFILLPDPVDQLFIFLNYIFIIMRNRRYNQQVGFFYFLNIYRMNRKEAGIQISVLSQNRLSGFPSRICFPFFANSAFALVRISKEPEMLLMLRVPVWDNDRHLLHDKIFETKIQDYVVQINPIECLFHTRCPTN